MERPKNTRSAARLSNEGDAKQQILTSCKNEALQGSSSAVDHYKLACLLLVCGQVAEAAINSYTTAEADADLFPNGVNVSAPPFLTLLRRTLVERKQEPCLNLHY